MQQWLEGNRGQKKFFIFLCLEILDTKAYQSTGRMTQLKGGKEIQEGCNRRIKVLNEIHKSTSRGNIATVCNRKEGEIYRFRYIEIVELMKGK